MTIGEMIKKVDTYNEVAKIAGVDKICLVFQDGSERETVRDIKSFKEYLKETYIDCYAKAIINNASWEMDEDCEISAVDNWGYEHKGFPSFRLWVEL